MADLAWMSCGGMLLDGTGDLATVDEWTSLVDMVNTRLKAAIDGWKLYRIGADLEKRIGDTVSDELETILCRQVENALTRELLPVGTFTVKSLAVGDTIDLYVYLNQQLLTSASVSKTGGVSVGS